jgi:hypothetical protein
MEAVSNRGNPKHNYLATSATTELVLIIGLHNIVIKAFPSSQVGRIKVRIC